VAAEEHARGEEGATHGPVPTRLPVVAEAGATVDSSGVEFRGHRPPRDGAPVDVGGISVRVTAVSSALDARRTVCAGNRSRRKITA